MQTTKHEPQRLAVSIREAAVMLGVSSRYIQKFLRIRALPSRKLGRRTLILIGDLQAFLAKDQPSPLKGKQ